MASTACIVTGQECEQQLRMQSLKMTLQHQNVQQQILQARGSKSGKLVQRTAKLTPSFLHTLLLTESWQTFATIKLPTCVAGQGRQSLAAAEHQGSQADLQSLLDAGLSCGDAGT